MAILRPGRILCTLFLLLLRFSFTSQEEFYINCGSSSSITLGRRNFVGDANSRIFTLTPSQTTILENPSPVTNSSSLYNTARVFRGESFWYEFGIVQNGTYILRLHFSPFVSRDFNLFEAKFDVLASRISLLSNFSVSSKSNFPLIEEFLLTINRGKFRINFSPVSSSSLAFINAIELNVTPSDPRLFIPDSAPHVTRFGNNQESSTFNGLLSNVLHVIHRINVGGTVVTPDNDTLPRNWVPDDEYLLLPDAAKNEEVKDPQLNYDFEGATPYDAPNSVYRCAKVMNTNTSDAIRLIFNVSWRFNVSKNDKFFVRAHFCDIVSQVMSTKIIFNLYIYNGYSKQINPRDGSWRPAVAVPFYHDFIVDSDDSGFLNISIGGPSQDSSIQTAFLNGLEIMKLMPGLVSPIPEQRSNSNTKKIIIIIVSVVGGSVFLLILSMAIFLFASKKKITKSVVENFDRPVYGGSSKSNSSPSPLQILHLGLKLPLSDILSATNNFDEKLIIGKGGFGKVYKGILRKTGTKIAVKRCDPGGRQGLPEFQTEIMLLSKIRHRHLVSLIGYCDEKSEMVLVYEFMEKGTLREHLYGNKGKSDSESESESSRLSWERRLQLCIDAAKGLHYLHSGLNGSIIHRDVKSTNILLDENYVAKVADFGISRTGAGWGGVDDQKSHVTTDVKGTLGYLDPEYYKSIQLTQKSDVYSFGVVLLEVLCARPAIDTSLPGEEVNLAEWGTCCIVKGELNKLMVDPFLVGKINSNSLRKFTETVEKCLRENGADRPNMVDVVWDLEYALQLQNTAAAVLPRQPKQEQEQEQPMEYSTTDVSCDLLMLPAVINSLPTHHSISISINSQQEQEEEDPDTSYTTNASEVFSQLKMEEAR